MNFLIWAAAFFALIMMTFYAYQTVGGVTGNTMGTGLFMITLWGFVNMLAAAWDDFRDLLRGPQ